ncbi:MAG TPA: hypothetical protein ENI52_03825 [Thermoplasmata archaeon]|nr:hypothetical protein [Thermoplasmata archaeon]
MSISESLKQKIPESLKPPLRILLKRLQPLKRNPIKEFKIKQIQEKLLKENYSPNTNKLIVFLTPGYDIVNGGILSISSIYIESVKLKPIHGAQVVLCTVPNDPPLLKYTKFKNQNYIYRFSQILSYFQNLEYLMIHIPEYAVNRFLKNISPLEYTKFKKMKNIHFNIMLQNIKLLSSVEDIEKLKKFGKVTCTTAHEQYSSLETRKRLGVPLHKLSTYVSPEFYDRKSYTEKKDLMIVSPDAHPRKKEILNLIRKQLPGIDIKVIKNLTYEEYKTILSRAKWALTFGEGLDGYFVETIFSGGISFAVYNPEFFTEDFKHLLTVYNDFGTLIKNICSDIENLDNPKKYTTYQSEQYNICRKYYNYKKYIKNLELFYRGEYTYG